MKTKIWMVFVFLIIFIGTGSFVKAESYYFNEELFLTNSSEFLSFESFETFSADNSLYGSLDIINAVNFLLTTSPETNLSICDREIYGMHATDGLQYVNWVATPVNSNITFIFTNPIQNFGFTITDPLDGGITSASMSLLTNGGSTFSNFISGAIVDGSENFFGIITDIPFTQITLTINQVPGGGDGVGIDGIYYNINPVPLPSALWFLSIGLIGIITYKQKQ